MWGLRIQELTAGDNAWYNVMPLLAGASLAAVLTGLAAALLVGMWMVRAFKRRGVIEDPTMPYHAGLNAAQQLKKSVPTMGGLMIMAAVVVTCALWADVLNPHIATGLFCMLALGVVGIVDDYIKLKHHPRRGLRKRTKLLWQFIIGIIVGYMLYSHGHGPAYTGASVTRVFLPFGEWHSIDLGWGYILWVAFIIMATSNAINLTDGLDGLAGGCTAIAAATLLVCGILIAVPPLAVQLQIHLPEIAAAPALCMLAAATVGAVLGFLWYNCHPARIFMGDTGSLALGGMLGFLGLALKLDLLLLMIGAVFYADMLTVALQIVGYKLTHKRIFPIAPIHHYFQLYRHWPEQRITVRLWIIAALAAVASLATLKLG